MPRRGDNPIAEHIGNELQAALDERGMTKTDLAKAVGVSPVAIHLRLTGKCGIDTADLWAMCDALDLDPAVVTRNARIAKAVADNVDYRREADAA